MTEPSDADLWTVEAVRGFAALMVLTARYAPALGVSGSLVGFTFTGVDLFFVVLGYVFAPTILGAKRRSWAAFAIRRGFRIYPLYLLALGSYIALRALSNQPVEHVLEHVLLLHTLQSRETALFYNPAFWSLPPEIEFYLCIPLLHWLVAGSDRRLWLLLGVALAARLALASAHDTREPDTAFYVASAHLPGLLAEFLLGTAAWRWRSAGLARQGENLLAAAAVIWLALALVFPLVNRPETLAGRLVLNNISLLAASGFALLVMGAVSLEPLPVPAGVKNLCRTLGNMSFALYLWHNAVLWLVQRWLGAAAGPTLQLLAALALLLPLCLVLHHVVEAPMRRFGRVLGSALSRRPAALA